MFDWGKFRNFAVWKEQETPFPNPFPMEGQGSRKSKKVSLRKGVRWRRSPDKWRTKSEEYHSAHGHRQWGQL